MAGPRFGPLNLSFVFPFPGNLAAPGHQANANMLWARPVVTASGDPCITVILAKAGIQKSLW